MKKILHLVLFLALSLTMVALGAETNETPVFERGFAWASVTDEESARTYADIGVTDIGASGEKGVAAAKKYGMREVFKRHTRGGLSVTAEATGKTPSEKISFA